MNLGKTLTQETVTLILVTAIITSLVVGVFGKKLAEVLLDALLRPLRALRDRTYQWIARRNPFSLSLRVYRKHLLRSHLTRIETPVGPTLEVRLERAFVPLRLVSNSHLDRKMDLLGHTAAIRRLMILGGPGTGKTTLLKHLVISVIKKHSNHELNELIPVFIVLRNLAKNQHTVQQAIEAALEDHHFPGCHTFVGASLAAGKMLIVLDGLDEVGASREFVIEEICRFCHRDSQREFPNRLLVSCREQSYRGRDLQEWIPEVLYVEPLTSQAIRTFLAVWPSFKGRNAIQLYGAIQQNAQIRDICGNPLILSILVGMYLESEDFELPSSRAQFYRSAIEELMVRRPARRNIQQIYSERLKHSVLERLALQKIQDLSLAQDTEEITYEAFREAAMIELVENPREVEELIRELIEVNGIIRPTSAGKYTFIHRTVQEYLASREVLRRREISDIVVTFGGNPDLIEILLFCCGSLDNLPALGRVIDSLAGQERWLDAGRCLVHMTEPPDSSTVAKVAAQLRDQVTASADGYQAIAVLSSLASRHGVAFDPARSIFSETVDGIVENRAHGLTLRSLMRTSPESLPCLIPRLLRNPAEHWRAVDPMFLDEDIPVDEVIDRLVQLLSDQDPVARFRAAALLAESITSRNAAMRQRAALLTARQDDDLWPLEAYFPGTLALAIAEGLAPVSLSGNAAIDCAIVAIRMRRGGSDGDFLRKWHSVPRDARLRRWRLRVADFLVRLGAVLAFAAACVLMPVYYLTLPPSVRWYEVARVAVMNLLTLYSLYVVLRDKSGRLLATLDSYEEKLPRKGGIFRALHRFFSGPGLPLNLLAPVLSILVTPHKPFSSTLVWLYATLPLAGLLLRNFPWPRNPFLVALDNVVQDRSITRLLDNPVSYAAGYYPEMELTGWPGDVRRHAPSEGNQEAALGNTRINPGSRATRST